MFLGGERHRERKRIGVLRLAPAVVVNKCQAASGIVADAPDFLAAEKSDEFAGHVAFFRALATMELTSMPVEARRLGVGCSAPASSRMFRASKARSTRANSARGCPCS